MREIFYLRHITNSDSIEKLMTKSCSHCHSFNAVEHRFCQQCGHPLATVVPSVDATVRWSGRPLSTKSLARQEVPVETLFAKRDRLVIGRAADCDLPLVHPSVSRYHAILERLPDGFRLSDLNSVNGVSVNGRRISDPVYVQERQRVGIGPFLFSMSEGVVYSLDSSQSLRLEARQVEKVIVLEDGKDRKLLDNINMVMEPGEFVGLLGPSGSGKSTLMDCLNGRRRSTGGQVLANGEDFYQHFDSFRQSLGYVPQKDIVHTQLSVARALHYTAQLRLPVDSEPAELQVRVEEVLAQMELLPHRNTLIGNLSGGQIKRVSLGAELLARPCLLFIDEATSGLDAGTEARMMRLFRQLSDQGKSIVCITHNVDNVDRCHLVILLLRGKLVFYGPPKEAPAYFGVSRLSDIYDRLAEREAEAWERQYLGSEFHREFVAKRQSAEPAPRLDAPTVLGAPGVVPSVPPALAERETPPAGTTQLGEAIRSQWKQWPMLHQFRILTARYAELMWGDKRSFRLLLLQAPIVAAFIFLGFVNKPYQDERTTAPILRRLTEAQKDVLKAVIANKELDPAKIPDLDDEQRHALEEFRARLAIVSLPIDKEKEIQRLRKILELDERGKAILPTEQTFIDPKFTYMLLYMLTITVLWFGCNNAAKEIVKEEAIYGRERAVNLGILPYLASKFLVLSGISAIQVLQLMVLIYGSLELVQGGQNMPPAEYLLGYLPQFGVLVLLAMTGVALGLLLSACVSSPDRANALLPYVLIPQIILGGGIMPIKDGPLHFFAMLFSPVYWAFRAARRGATTLPDFVTIRMEYNDSVTLACGALAAETIIFLLLTGWFLKRKDAA